MEQQIQVQLKEVAGLLIQEEATFTAQAQQQIERRLVIVQLIIERRLQAEHQIAQTLLTELSLQVEQQIAQVQLLLLQDKLYQVEVKALHQAEVLKVLIQDKATLPLRVLKHQDRIVAQQHQQGVPILNPHQAELVVQVDKFQLNNVCVFNKWKEAV